MLFFRGGHRFGSGCGGFEEILEFGGDVGMLSGLCDPVVEFMAAGAIVRVMTFFRACFHREYVFFRVRLGEPRLSMAFCATAISPMAGAVVTEHASRNQRLLYIFRSGWSPCEHARMTCEAIAGRHFRRKTFKIYRDAFVHGFYQGSRREDRHNIHAALLMIAFQDFSQLRRKHKFPRKHFIGTINR